MAKPTARASGTKSSRGPLHDERWNEDGENGEHGKEARDERFVNGATDGQSQRAACLHLNVDVLDGDGCFIDKNTDGKSETAQCHQVDGLPAQSQRDDRASQGERDVQNDDDHAPPVPEEDQHHQSDQGRGQGALHGDAGDRVRHVGRLVELETHTDVGRQDALHLG